jgi:tetratricopeptide (TPR) repeat protein
MRGKRGPVSSTIAGVDKKAERILRTANELLDERRDAEAAREYGRALRLDPRLPGARRGLAIVAQRAGRLGEALQHLQGAIQLAPNAAALRADLGRMLALAGRHAEADAEFGRALQQAPDDPELWDLYALALLAAQRKGDALNAALRALALGPERVATRERAARLLLEVGQPDAAVEHWRALAARDSLNEEYQLGLTQALWDAGRTREGLEAYADAARLLPGSADLAMARGLAVQDQGDRDLAAAEFERALRLRPGWEYPLGTLLEMQKDAAGANHIAAAERGLEETSRPAAARALLAFGLGKVYESRKLYEAAFGAWSRGNALRRELQDPMSRERMLERRRRLCAVFTPERLRTGASLGVPDERPVFIVGMPRSGTTLVEQIVAAHPQADGCGELPDLARIARGLSGAIGTLTQWPESAAALTPAVAQAAARHYLDVIGRRARAGARRVTDKAPANFFYLGLVALLFPRAHVVWCRRDPRDVAVSIFSENFAVQQTYATRLEDIAFYYHEQERLMRYWQQVLPLPIVTVNYEELVADFEPNVRRLLDALGLPFAPECLAFHEAQRAVLTPSRWQVRQPLYGSSVGRWKRYEPWLGPLLRALADDTGGA